MTSDYSFYRRAAAASPEPSLEGGASGYFSAPADTLDPNLFNGERMKPEVRARIMVRLFEWLEANGFNGDHNWLHAWVAGSGVTYQWAASRGNGDLDVLFGIDFTKFLAANPDWHGTPETELAMHVNSRLKEDLWPLTAKTKFGSGHYEVTYFLNPGTGTDIRNINAYAAYDLVNDKWSIRPPELPADPRTLYPHEWFDVADYDRAAADGLSSRYKALTARLSGAQEGSAAWHNAGADLHQVIAQASALFDDIHLGRRGAFAPQGHGYGDYRNFRWQQGKATGAVQALNAIATVGRQARAGEETEMYGAPIDPAEVVLARAALFHQNGS